MRRLLTLVTFSVLNYSALSALAEANLLVTDFYFKSATVETLTYPDQVWFTIGNYGPGSICDVQLEFILSRNSTAGDADDQPLAAFVHTVCMDPYTGYYDSLSTSERAQLTLPANASGDYYLFLRATPASDFDPYLWDNLTLATNRMTVPAPGSTYAVFAGGSIVTSNMAIYPGASFAYNLYYGNCWRLTAPGGYFTGTFSVPHPGPYSLRARHATSSASGCPNNGYAPVSIFVNGASVASDYDVAAGHASYWFENDTWTIQANAGENTLQWVAGNLCTHYWIQRIEITPLPLPPAITSFRCSEGGGALLGIAGQPGRTNVIEFSEDLRSWSPLTNLHNATGLLEWGGPAPASGRGFYRVVELVH